MKKYLVLFAMMAMTWSAYSQDRVTYRCTGNNVNVRKGPGTNYAVITYNRCKIQLFKEEWAEGDGKQSNGFIHIVKPRDGWVSAQYLRIVEKHVTSKSQQQDERFIAFIKDMWNNNRYENDAFLEKHCTPKMLKKLKDSDYDFFEGYNTQIFHAEFHDCGNRTELLKVFPMDDGWYRYDFYDSGAKCAIDLKMFEKNGVIMIDDLIVVEAGDGYDCGIHF